MKINPVAEYSFSMKRLVFIAILVIIISTSCWYYSFTDESVYTNIEYVYVESFTNKTEEYDVEVDLREKIINDLIGRHLFKIVSKKEEADAVVKATVKRFNRKAQVYNEQEEVQEYMIEFFSKVSFYNMDKKENIWVATFRGWGSYLPQESEDEATEKALNMLTDKVINKLSSG